MPARPPLIRARQRSAPNDAHAPTNAAARMNPCACVRSNREVITSRPDVRSSVSKITSTSQKIEMSVMPATASRRSGERIHGVTRRSVRAAPANAATAASADQAHIEGSRAASSTAPNVSRPRPAAQCRSSIKVPIARSAPSQTTLSARV
jgi:hypothetical protein